MRQFVLLLIMLFSLEGRAQRTNNSKTEILYRTFPELEKKICEAIRIDFHGNADSIFIAISPFILDNKLSYTEYTIYSVHIDDIDYDERPTIVDIVRKTNRVMKACNFTLPVYLNLVDQNFTSKPDEFTKENGTKIHLWHKRAIGIVDMSTEKFR